MLKYEIETKKFSELRDKVEIPKFQRGLVWNRDKKREFIKTLKAGLPIGVLLLSPKDDHYLVIDGLQRFTTMRDYARNFFAYIDQEEITDFDLNSIILKSSDARRIFDEYSQEIKARQFNEMRHILVDEITSGQEKNFFTISADATKQLCNKIAALPEKDYQNIQAAVYEIVEKISNQARIDDVTIPLIIFKGKEDELANIFQKLNQEGVKLSKYDVFAATWIDHSIVVKDDPEFIEYIIKKYEAAQDDSDLEIADYDPDLMKQNGELTVFEYAFAVGKALMDKCKRLFPKMDDSKIDSIGFLLLAELVGLSYQKMGKLAEKLLSFDKLDYKKLKDSILDSTSIVESALSLYIESPTKPKRGKKRASLVCHSELQLASYIVVIWKLKYKLDPSGELLHLPTNGKIIAKVKDFLHKHYLYDILRGYWAGSGDSKLEDIIANPENCRYTKDVAKEDFELAVLGWMRDMNQKTGLINVSTETKLFLNYLLRARKGNNEVEKSSYDIEHCVPRDTLRKYYLKKKILVPISPVCNLIYIPSKDNQSKGEQTYYERQKTNPGAYTLDFDQLDKLLYPTRGELRFLESTSTLTKDKYLEFLANREKILLHAFMEAFYP